MSDYQPNAPIVVAPTAAYAITEAGLGQLIQAIGSGLSVYGLVDSNKWALLVGPLTVIATFVWRTWKAQSNHAKLVITANASPDSVAKVRG